MECVYTSAAAEWAIVLGVFISYDGSTAPIVSYGRHISSLLRRPKAQIIIIINRFVSSFCAVAIRAPIATTAAALRLPLLTVFSALLCPRCGVRGTVPPRSGSSPSQTTAAFTSTVVRREVSCYHRHVVFSQLSAPRRSVRLARSRRLRHVKAAGTRVIPL